MSQEIIAVGDNVVVGFANEDRIMHYVERYRAFARNTAESIIGLGQTIAEASSTLTGAELDEFCEQVGIEANGPTFRKLRKIGAQAERLLAHRENLPNSWTTVYALAQIDKDKFAQLVEQQALSPTVSMKEINAVLSGQKVVVDKLAINVSIEVTSAEQAFQLEQACNALVAQHGGKVRWSNNDKRNAMMAMLLEQKMAA